MLAVANIAFFVFHTALILFNVLGWAHPKTRQWNLATLLLTLVSWVGMGLWKGMGFCICTEWHWNIRRSMGIEESADSYLILLIRNISGWDPPVGLVNSIAAVVFGASLVLSIVFNTLDFRRNREAANSQD